MQKPSEQTGHQGVFGVQKAQTIKQKSSMIYILLKRVVNSLHGSMEKKKKFPGPERPGNLTIR